MSVNYQVVFESASQAALAASRAAVCQPMVVNSGGEQYFVGDGVCGFGWVHFSDGRSPVVKWLKAKKIGFKDYKKGWNVHASQLGAGFTQSMQRNESACAAAADVFKQAGVECYADSRID